MQTLATMEAQVKPPTSEDYAALQNSMRDLSTKSTTLRNHYEDEIQRIEDFYAEELSYRDNTEHDLRKRLHLAREEIARLPGARDAHVKQLDWLKPPPSERRSRASSDVFLDRRLPERMQNRDRDLILARLLRIGVGDRDRNLRRRRGRRRCVAHMLGKTQGRGGVGGARMS